MSNFKGAMLNFGSSWLATETPDIVATVTMRIYGGAMLAAEVGPWMTPLEGEGEDGTCGSASSSPWGASGAHGKHDQQRGEWQCWRKAWRNPQFCCRCASSATMITSTSQVQSSSGQFEELLVPTEWRCHCQWNSPKQSPGSREGGNLKRHRHPFLANLRIISKLLDRKCPTWMSCGAVPDMDVLRSLLDSNRPCKKSMSGTVGNSRPDRIEEGEEAFREAAPPWCQ